MKRILFPLFLLIVVFSFSIANGEDVESLRGGTDIPAGSTPAVGIDWKPPHAAVTRTFIHQPPLIPHTVDGYTITSSKNDCMGCHGLKGSGIPKPHQSHYTDREGKPTKKISPRWHFCTQCHVGQVDAKPLVENTFQAQ